MKVRKRLQTYTGILTFVCIIFMQLVSMHATELEYQERASEIIINSLQGQTEQSFLKKLYKQLFFVPAWMHKTKLSPAARDLFEHIKNDGTLDKRGKLYEDTLLLEDRAYDIYAGEGSIAQKINLEFKISQLYHGYTNYAYLGSINWGAFQARISNLMVNDVSTEWVLHRPRVDAMSMLENAALGGSLAQQLQDVTPKQYHYRALQKELERYREIKANGAWTRVALDATLNAGDTADGVHNLRERLAATGDYTACKWGQETPLYDICLQKAVKSFQLRNGLAPDGAVGPATLRVLNITVDERITTILLNLDRIKWLKERKSKRHVIINIPDFMLYFEEDGKLRQSIRTIVGKPKNPTPIFSNTVKTIVLNPYWNIPTSIIQKEMIPELLKNSNAMKKRDIEIRTGWGKDAPIVEASTVNWNQYRYSKGVPFRFAQVPGTKNALGKVKFLFPNKYAVYMHDTPTKHLFSKNKRAFSHGCIRLQKPRELLETFSTFNDNVDFEKSQEILKGKDKTYMSLKQTVPVDVVYLTAWVDYDDKLQFRNDIYDYDKMQLKSFRKW